ncbi:MAG: DUF1080 domain-containing protein, partial [bacterium]|nr:DUF1080 domain-containing protein [bacterium]
MFRRLCGVFLIFPSIALPAQGDGSVAGDSSAVERLFDGESLQGWHGAPGLWRVEDGCIVGSTVGVERRRTTYLFWEGADAADFELTFDVRVDGNNNSGVHYRSRELANFDVAGYQCDVHGAPNYFGMFYEEKGAAVLCQHGQFVARGPDGRNRVVGRIAQPGKSPADLAKWHTFKVVARGNVIQHYVDGRLAAMVMDDRREAPRSGKIALQVHGGPPMTVWFRNLVLKRLPAVEVAKLPPLADALLARERGTKSTGPRPQWIWDASTQGEEDVFFRREFDVEG